MKNIYVKNLELKANFFNPFYLKWLKQKSNLSPFLFLWAILFCLIPALAQPLCTSVFSNAAGTTSGNLNANSGAKLFFTESNSNILSVGSITGTNLICEGGTVNCSATSRAPTMILPTAPSGGNNTDLTINSGQTTTFSANTTRQSASINGTLNLDGDIYLNLKNNSGNARDFTLNSGGILNVNGNVTIYARDFGFNGTININSGSLTIIGTRNVNFNSNSVTNTGGTYDKIVVLNGSTLNVNSTVNAIIYSQGTANINSGGTVNGAVTAGNMQLNGTIYYRQNAIQSATIPGCDSKSTPLIDYHFDECSWNGTSQEVKDTSGNNLHATAINSDNSSLQSGVMNNAGDFNRTKSQYIQLPTLTTDKVNFNDGFTITSWAKFSNTVGNWERIFDFGNGTDSNNIFLGRDWTTNTLILGIHESSAGEVYLRANDALDALWHFWAVSCSGSTCKLYKDGAVIATSTSMKIPSHINRTSNYIGKSNWNDDYFQGGIDELKVFDQYLEDAQIQAIYNNERTQKNYDGTQRDAITCSACEVLTDGYHIINPFSVTEKKFEIYCQNKKNYLMLPFYNAIAPNSNFLFTNNPVDNNYYHSSNAKKAIKMLEVSFDTQNTRLKIKKIIYEDASEGYDFSNLNLIGTPFAFFAPRDTSTIKQCSANDTSRLRVGMNQVLKINPKASGYSRACVIDEPSIRFLTDYKFLEFDGAESLFVDCANLASNTTSEQIPEVTGAFFIDPKKLGRNHTQRDRPFVASCKYQSDLNQAWTFVLALDGYTTTTKNDATNKTDTCSKLGLTFFIPNSKTTFGRVRQFLFDSQPSEWGNYVGTVEEYFTDNAITGWATDDQVSELKPNPVPNGLMWPYGPMGIYRPLDGNGGSNDKKMPKSPQYLSTAEIAAGFGSMQETGWRSLYYDYHGDGNLTRDLWWVADIAAGYRANLTAQNPKPIEPNGDYDANNWLGWFTDTNGNVVHYNDQNTVNGQYRYSNYMCMSYANIDEIIRYQPVLGAFDIIERSVASGREINNRFIQTKIVNAPILLDMIILKDDESALQPDKNVSVGVFLNDIEMIGNTETPRDISYIGDIKRDNTGSLSNHKPTGRFSLQNLSRSSANQKLFFKFKYCNTSSFEWTDCWTRSGNSATCKPEQALQCKSVDSDYFAVRPDKFGISIAGVSPNLLKAGEDYNVNIIAQEYNSASPTTGYNQSKSNLTIQNPPAKLFRNGTIDSNNTLQGILTVGATNYNFINGITNEMTINFTDVGRISFDINDSEWAKIDITDTAEINRTIQGDVNVTFIPYRFTVSGVRITNTQDSNFTYISNDLNMSAHLDFTITAQTKQGNATQNFSSGLYENNISITPSIIDNTHEEANHSMINSLSLGFTSGTKHIAWNETNTSQNIYFNFTRSTLPINPFDINNSEVNLSIASLYTDEGTSATVENNITNKDGMTNGTLGSATFYYGRVHAPDQRFNDTNGTANIYYEVYCRDCTTAFRTSMGITGNESVDAINWYQNSLHVNNTFGEFNTTAPTTTVGGLTLGARTLSTQQLTATSTPHVNRINFGSSSWLRYYPEYFNVSFTHTGSQWAGEGSVDRNETGNVGKFTNDRNVTRSQRRLNW